MDWRGDWLAQKAQAIASAVILYPHRACCSPALLAALVLTFVLGFCGKGIGARLEQRAVSNFRALASQANAARDANQLDRAVILYKKALRLRPGWAKGWWSLGTILYDQNSYAEAASSFRRVVSLSPKDGTAWAMLGLSEFALGKDAAALAHLEKGQNLGVAKDPQLDQVILYHEGVLLKREGEFETAREKLAPLCQQGVESGSLNRTLGMIVLRIPRQNAETQTSPGNKVVAQLGKAEWLAAQYRFGEAERIDNQMVSQYPNFPNIHYAYGTLLLEALQPKLAVEQFKLEIKNNPRQAFAWLEIAAARYRVDSAGGIRYAEEGVKLDPQLPFGHYLLGLLLLDTHQYQAALRQLEIAEPAFSSVPNLYFALGTAYSHLGRNQEAARAWAKFRRLRQKGPNTGPPHDVQKSMRSQANSKP